MAKTHEKGPWKITSMSGGCARVGTNESHTIALVGGRDQLGADANASRIVLCVNFLEGMTLEEMREMKAAWKRSKEQRKARIHEYHFSCRGTRTPSSQRAEA